MKIVRENINFERGSEDPFRSLDIGQYNRIRKELEEDPEIKVNDALAYAIDLSRYFEEVQGIRGKHLRISRILSKILAQYRKDAYHTKKVDFLKDMLSDIANDGWKLSEPDFINWVIQYTEEVDPNPGTLIDTIHGIWYATRMN